MRAPGRPEPDGELAVCQQPRDRRRDRERVERVDEQARVAVKHSVERAAYIAGDHPALPPLKAKFPEIKFLVGEFRDMVTVVVPCEHIVPVCAYLRDEPSLRFDMLAELNGVSPGPAFPAQDFAPPAPAHRWRWSLAALLLLLTVTVAGIVWLVVTTAPNDEADRLARAEQAYKDRDFAEAR